jgi:hypothetical protein
MSQPSSDSTPVAVYAIKLKGILSDEWSDWFNGMALYQDAEGNTIVSGPVVDQAALYGLLDKMRDLGLLLLSVTKLK